MESREPESILRRLLTIPNGRFKQKPPVQSEQDDTDGKKTAAQRREEEAQKNKQHFLAQDAKTQGEMLFDADWNLNTRYKTTQNSLVYSGLLFMGNCTMLAELFGSVPRSAKMFFAVSLALMLVGGMHAFSELFRRQPAELERTRQQREEQSAKESKPSPEAEIPLYDRLRSDRYAQMKNRVSHVQRNTFRMRWCTNLAALAFIGGLILLF